VQLNRRARVVWLDAGLAVTIFVAAPPQNANSDETRRLEMALIWRDREQVTYIFDTRIERLGKRIVVPVRVESLSRTTDWQAREGSIYIDCARLQYQPPGGNPLTRLPVDARSESDM
jgi:hypothetical protein